MKRRQTKRHFFLRETKQAHSRLKCIEIVLHVMKQTLKLVGGITTWILAKTGNPRVGVESTKTQPEKQRHLRTRVPTQSLLSFKHHTSLTR
jgi:hypothetical protein